jgi:hypothetical protein
VPSCCDRALVAGSALEDTRLHATHTLSPNDKPHTARPRGVAGAVTELTQRAVGGADWGCTSSVEECAPTSLHRPNLAQKDSQVCCRSRGSRSILSTLEDHAQARTRTCLQCTAHGSRSNILLICADLCVSQAQAAPQAQNRRMAARVQPSNGHNLTAAPLMRNSRSRSRSPRLGDPPSIRELNSEINTDLLSPTAMGAPAPTSSPALDRSSNPAAAQATPIKMEDVQLRCAEQLGMKPDGVFEIEPGRRGGGGGGAQTKGAAAGPARGGGGKGGGGWCCCGRTASPRGGACPQCLSPPKASWVRPPVHCGLSPDADAAQVEVVVAGAGPSAAGRVDRRRRRGMPRRRTRRQRSASAMS